MASSKDNAAKSTSDALTTAMTTTGLQSALYDAAQLGDVMRLQTLLRSGADVNALSCDDRAPAIVYAASNGHTDCVRTLLAAGADVNATDSLGNTALFKAACYNYIQCAHVLLQSGADPSKTNKWGAIPLQLAALQGFTVMLDLLMQHGANVSAAGNGFYGNQRLPPPLVAATTRCHITCIKLLLSNKTQLIAMELDSALTIALYYHLCACAGFQSVSAHVTLHERMTCLRLLIDGGAPLNAEHLRMTCYPYFIPVVNLKPYVNLLKLMLEAAPYNAANSGDDPWHDVMMLLFGHVTRLGHYKWELIQLMCSVGFVASEDLLDGLAFAFTNDEMGQLRALRKAPKSLAHSAKLIIRRHVTTNVHDAMTSLNYPPLLKKFVLSKDI